MAVATVAGAKAKGIEAGNTQGFEAEMGKGVQGTASGRNVALGNETMMQGLALAATGAEVQADVFRATGKTAMFVALDGVLAGIGAVVDPVPNSTAAAIKEPHAQSLRVIMVTGHR